MITHKKQGLAAFSLSRRLVMLAGSGAAVAMMVRPQPAAAESDGISRTAESIHQEVSFAGEPRRVYAALTETKRFDRVVQLSGVMQSAALAQHKEPTEISQQEGGTFSAFGGYITGRQIALVPSELIVQAWRVGNWDRGVYSIARFVLQPMGSGTKLLFDHTGFPLGDADHLSTGWREHYWDPLRKYLLEG